jgi:hypothetical protein
MLWGLQYDGGPFGTVPEFLFEKKALIAEIQRMLIQPTGRVGEAGSAVHNIMRLTLPLSFKNAGSKRRGSIKSQADDRIPWGQLNRSANA